MIVLFYRLALRKLPKATVFDHLSARRPDNSDTNFDAPFRPSFERTRTNVR